MVCRECKGTYEWGSNAGKVELQSGFCPECWLKPFAITSVCRGDLAGAFKPEQIAKMDDGEMEYLAGKMADAYCDFSFWDDLEIIVARILNED
jgi:hypothetical protein